MKNLLLLFALVGFSASASYRYACVAQDEDALSLDRKAPLKQHVIVSDGEKYVCKLKSHPHQADFLCYRNSGGYDDTPCTCFEQIEGPNGPQNGSIVGYSCVPGRTVED